MAKDLGFQTRFPRRHRTHLRHAAALLLDLGLPALLILTFQVALAQFCHGHRRSRHGCVGSTLNNRAPTRF